METDLSWQYKNHFWLELILFYNGNKSFRVTYQYLMIYTFPNLAGGNGDYFQSICTLRIVPSNSSRGAFPGPWGVPSHACVTRAPLESRAGASDSTLGSPSADPFLLQHSACRRVVTLASAGSQICLLNLGRRLHAFYDLFLGRKLGQLWSSSPQFLT